MENSRKGSENKAAVSGTSASCIPFDNAMFRPTNVTTILRALSLNAPSNWVTIKLQNPRKRGFAAPAASV